MDLSVSRFGKLSRSLCRLPSLNNFLSSSAWSDSQTVSTRECFVVHLGSRLLYLLLFPSLRLRRIHLRLPLQVDQPRMTVFA